MASNRLQEKKILIVDDEPDVLDVLEDLLAGCHVEKAGNFEEAREKLETGHFDIAILDIMGVSGYDLLKLTTEKKIVTVMLTAHALSPDNVVKSYREGAAFYLPKEEMVNIQSYLVDILEDLQKGKNTWERWLERLSAYCERQFGADWQNKDKAFWEKFPFY